MEEKNVTIGGLAWDTEDECGRTGFDSMFFNMESSRQKQALNDWIEELTNLRDGGLENTSEEFQIYALEQMSGFAEDEDEDEEDHDVVIVKRIIRPKWWQIWRWPGYILNLMRVMEEMDVFLKLTLRQ